MIYFFILLDPSILLTLVKYNWGLNEHGVIMIDPISSLG